MASMVRALMILICLLAPLVASAQGPTRDQMIEVVRLGKQAQLCGLARDAQELDTFNKNATRFGADGNVESFTEMLCLRMGCVDGDGKTRPALQVAKPADCAAFLQRFRAMRMTKADWTPAEGFR